MAFRPKALEEDLRFTEYRLQIARELPAGSFRDALVGGIASRLAVLASTCDERVLATDHRNAVESLHRFRTPAGSRCDMPDSDVR